MKPSMDNTKLSEAHRRACIEWCALSAHACSVAEQWARTTAAWLQSVEDNATELTQKWKAVHIVLVCTLTDQFMHLKHLQNGGDHSGRSIHLNLMAMHLSHNNETDKLYWPVNFDRNCSELAPPHFEWNVPPPVCLHIWCIEMCVQVEAVSAKCKFQCKGWPAR